MLLEALWRSAASNRFAETLRYAFTVQVSSAPFINLDGGAQRSVTPAGHALHLSDKQVNCSSIQKRSARNCFVTLGKSELLASVRVLSGSRPWHAALACQPVVSRLMQVVLLSGFQSFPHDAITVEFWMWSVDACRLGTPFSYATGRLRFSAGPCVLCCAVSNGLPPGCAMAALRSPNPIQQTMSGALLSLAVCRGVQ